MITEQSRYPSHINIRGKLSKQTLSHMGISRKSVIQTGTQNPNQGTNKIII